MNDEALLLVDGVRLYVKSRGGRVVRVSSWLLGSSQLIARYAVGCTRTACLTFGLQKVNRLEVMRCAVNGNGSRDTNYIRIEYFVSFKSTVKKCALSKS